MVVGGKTANDVGKLYFQPTLLANVTDEMDIVHQEVFGPVISMIPWVVLSFFSACDQKTHPILLSSFKQFNDLSLMSDSAILQMAWFAVVCTCKKRKQYLNQTVHHSTARCRHAYQMLDSEYRGNYKDLNLPKYMGWYGAVYFEKTVQ